MKHIISGTYTGLNYPSAINEAGDTVGSYQTCSGAECKNHGFVRSVSGIIAEISFPGAAGTALRGINNSGQLPGYYPDANGLEHSFIRQANGTFVSIYPPSYLMGSPVELFSINNNGDVLGGVWCH